MKRKIKKILSLMLCFVALFMCISSVDVQAAVNEPPTARCVYFYADRQITTYNSQGTTSIGYLSRNDYCYFDYATLNNSFLRVIYPTANGKKEGWVPRRELIPSDAFIGGMVTTDGATTYRFSDLATPFGTVYKNDIVGVCEDRGNICKILYPLDAGGYKMGWARTAELKLSLPFS